MDFIERLRQEAGAAERHAAETETKTNESHRQRQEQAKAFRQNSGIDVLIAEFTSILARMRPGVRHEFITPPSPVHRGQFLRDTLHTNPYANPQYPQVPNDVAYESVYDIVVLGTDVRHKPRGWYEDTITTVKYILIETKPDGTIAFTASQTAVVPLQEWKDNNTVLSAHLEQAFHSPRVREEVSTRQVYFGR